MTRISLIAAIDEAGGLGFNNQLLCHLPADLQHFKATTMGKPILMGRTTYESIGKPLPGRLNIVLSRTGTPIEGVLVLNSFDKALEAVGEIPELMVIGGAQVYAQAIALAERLYITRIHHRFSSDVFFPVIDDQLWACQSSEFRSKDEKNIYDLTFNIFDKR